MSKVRFELNRKGVRALLKGPEIQSVLGQAGGQVARRAGSGYSYSVHNRGAFNRAIAHVYPDTQEAREDNYNNNTLLRSLR